MLATPSVRLVLALALPVLAQQGLHLIVSLSDSKIGGLLAESAALQAAQTTTHYLSWATTSFIVIVTVGSTALVARFVGAGDLSLARDVLHQSLILAGVFGTALSLAGLCGGIELAIGVLNLEGDTARFAAEYLAVNFSLLVFQVVESATIACLIGAGDTRTGLFVMIGVAVLNVPLAWGFAFGWGPLPALGFEGIALGTGLCHVLGCAAALTVVVVGRFDLKFEWRRLRPRFDLIRRLLRVSVPAAADSMSTVVGQFWFLSIVNRLGPVAGGAHGIALRWEALGYLSGAAFGTAAMTLVGQNLGAGRPDMARRSGFLAFALGAGLMSTMGVVFYVFAPEMFRGLTSDADIIRVGVPVLRLVAFAMPALAPVIIFTSALRGAGDTRMPVLFTWIGLFAVRIPLAYFLTRPSVDLGLYGAWLAMFADLFIRGAFFLTRFVRGKWQATKV